jgi:hypothetical protein
MKVAIQKPAWNQDPLTDESIEAISLLSGVWRDACSSFAATSEMRIANNKKPPMGIQQFINDEIDERFLSAGWEGKDAKFRKNDTWVVISFRHQMSLGSDLYNALLLWKKEGIKQVLLLAGTLDFLKIITPLDANTLTSFERYATAISQLNGTFNPPLIIGALEPSSKLDGSVGELVFGNRLRNSRT